MLEEEAGEEEDCSEQQQVHQHLLKSFSKSADTVKYLGFMVSQYGQLIQKLPLQPKTAMKLINLWEVNLFSQIENQIEKDALRKRKMAEICLKREEEEIMLEISKTKKFLEQRKKDAEEEKKRDEVKKSFMGDLLISIANKRKINETEVAEKELENMEEGIIEDCEIPI